MTRQIDPVTLKKMLTDGHELALLDVREDGQFGEGHMLFAVPMPYSHLEARLDRQVPRRSTRTVLVDAGDGVAARAAARLTALGYSDVAILAGGMDAWGAAGYEVFK
jgi:rhodanese-related sulfurtransferase